MRIRRLLSYFIGSLFVAGLSSCSFPGFKAAQQNVGSLPDDIALIRLVNPSNFYRADNPVLLSLYDLGLPEVSDLKLLVEADGKVLDSQLIDSDGDGRRDSLFTLVSLQAGEEVQLEIKNAHNSRKPVEPESKRTQAEISHKIKGYWLDHSKYPGKKKQYEGGEFINVSQLTPPDFYADHSNWIRYEGPGIESDKVGYRIYLDERNGFDIFGKKDSSMALQKVGQDGYDSYHNMQPWGMDILKVGGSLGAGGFGAWLGEAVVPLKDVEHRAVQIVENGNVYSAFNIHYDNWKVNQQLVDVNAQFAMHAGSRLVQAQLQLTEDINSFAVGFVAHEEERIDGPMEIPGDAYTYIASYGKQSLAGDRLGMAVFFKKRDLQKLTKAASSHVAVLGPKGGELEYYFAAFWESEPSNNIHSMVDFIRALNHQAEMLTRPLRIDILRNAQQNKKVKKLNEPLYWSKALADSELQRKTLSYHHSGWDVNRKRKPKFEYDIVGLLPFAYDELAKLAGEQVYANIKYQTTATFIDGDGSIHRYKKSNYNIDSIAPGRVVLRLFKETGQLHYKKALQQLREQLHDQPRTKSGAFWHKKKYPHQLWLDGVYMGMPFLAEYSNHFEKPEGFERNWDEIINEFKITHQKLRDEKTGLYYHAWDESKQQIWADKNSGLSPHFWGRGMGWMAMALVDVFELLPEDRHADREFLKTMAVELAQALKQFQDERGVWWQIMDKPNALGNYRESSASAMFVYFLAKAVNMGLLNKSEFGGDPRIFTQQAYHSLVNEFMLLHADGSVSMTQQCLVAGLGFGRDGSYDYYMNEPVVKNDPKGTGPMILAGVEVFKMNRIYQ